MAKNSVGLLGNSSGMLEELLVLKELGILDGDKGNDQITKLLGMMSLNSNRFMGDMRDYTKASKRDGDGGGGGGRKNSGGGGSMFAMLESFNSLSLQSLFQSVETFLVGIEAGPVVTSFNAAKTYSLASWGTNAADDVNVIKYILNVLSAMAQAMRLESAMERTEAFYAMLEAFEGQKTWGQSGNLQGILPLMLLNGGGLGNSLTSGTFLPVTKF